MAPWVAQSAILSCQVVIVSVSSIGCIFAHSPDGFAPVHGLRGSVKWLSWGGQQPTSSGEPRFLGIPFTRVTTIDGGQGQAGFSVALGRQNVQNRRVFRCLSSEVSQVSGYNTLRSAPTKGIPSTQILPLPRAVKGNVEATPAQKIFHQQSQLWSCGLDKN